MRSSNPLSSSRDECNDVALFPSVRGPGRAVGCSVQVTNSYLRRAMLLSYEDLFHVSE